MQEWREVKINGKERKHCIDDMNSYLINSVIRNYITIPIDGENVKPLRRKSSCTFDCRL